MIKPGVLCWINHRCNVPQNIGIVVEIIALYGVLDGVNEWHVHSKSPVLCYHELDPHSSYQHCFGCPEYSLTPINGTELSEEDIQEIERERAEML